MHLLLVEDKDSFRRLLVQALEGSGWEIHAVAHPQEALAVLEATPCEIMVTDLRLPAMSGLELLKRAKRMRPELRVLLMSAFGEPSDIVEAMAFGADDFLPKPFDLDVFQATLERLQALTEAPSPDPREPWVAQSPSMSALDRTLGNLAESGASTLFIGERGSGRTRCARRLHTLRHPKAPFLTLDAASLGPEGPRGHQLAMLKGGTLHLQDLDGISPEGTQGLLRALGAPGIHWSGSASSLESIPAPLRPKLGVLVLSLAPLRERREDVLPLFRASLEQAARRIGRIPPVIDLRVERELLSRPWIGNVAELLWLAERCLSTCPDALLAALPTFQGMSQNLLELSWPDPGPLESMLARVQEQAEALLIRRALKANGSKLMETAQALGITHRLLSQRLREHHISLEDGGSGTP
ncbi:MAG: two component, sigma54 specific, transcriptional regulator, Fis family [Holophagaceae bacterium]|nr:two component, sigma54 specific, transcriptional regulator, Fis family [Holophagaceae bacterium]